MERPSALGREAGPPAQSPGDAHPATAPRMQRTDLQNGQSAASHHSTQSTAAWQGISLLSSGQSWQEHALHRQQKSPSPPDTDWAPFMPTLAQLGCSLAGQPRGGFLYLPQTNT
ncbi:lipoma HMGIC fusion partner-like 4 protein [Platysternon megacephalum]|uniref:Lipoma HMGIC fusion partner-like 4 protein n=1 Tax=Platysternon megacephalum TaxID=55544 RepID=A0A4D9DSW9_9SAUR|nr:lipoma HMGIC fusion partner-like 4 protein [Platysternon megacephalum]